MAKSLGKKEKNLMSKNNKHSIYSDSFSLFLKKTNEKEVILSHIKKAVKLSRETKFLDVGGGDGSFALPLSKKVKTTLVVEPNTLFVKKLSSKDINCFNGKWEQFNYNSTFDFVLAAYVITHFPKDKIRELIEKMFNYLSKTGKLVIVAVDDKAGSWRGVHTHFYNLINEKKESSAVQLREIMKEYNAKKRKITTEVAADNCEQMLRILAFDFEKYGNKFYKNKEKIIDYLNKRKRNEKIVLKMVQWIYIINK